jgi:hypothetical protein
LKLLKKWQKVSIEISLKQFNLKIANGLGGKRNGPIWFETEETSPVALRAS